MRRITVFLYMLAMVVPMYSQTLTNGVLLGRINGRLSVESGYECGFSFVAKDSEGNVMAESEGILYLKGHSFRMETEQITVVCDGVTKWMYDASVNELLIVKNDPSVRNIMENPFSIFDEPERDYDFRTSSGVSRNSDGLFVLKFEPRDRNMPYRNITVYANASYEPVKMEYVSKDGSGMTVTAGKGRALPENWESLFTFDPSGYEDIYVTDLR